MRKFPALLIAVFFAIAALASAQQYQPKSIQFKGAPEYSDQELLAAAQLKPGISLSVDAMKDHARILLDTGAFDNITFQFTGVELRYLLTPSKNLSTVHFTNLPLAAGKDLDAKIHDIVPLYHGKVPAGSGLMEQVRAALEQIVAQILAQNSAAPGIKPTVQALAVDRTAPGTPSTVNFSIASPPVVLGDILLDSKSPALDPGAAQILKKLAGSPYDLDGSPSQIATYLGNYYRDKGYAEVHAESSPMDAHATEDTIQIPLKVSLTPGMQYHLGEIRFAPDLLASHADFDRQAGIHFGDLAEGQKLTEEWQYISRQYHNHGYMQASIHPTPSFDRVKGLVSFDVSADSGPVYTMGKLTIENATNDLRATMLALWKMPEQSVFNEGAVFIFYLSGDNAHSMANLCKTVSCKYDLHLIEPAHTVDVVLRLEKKP